MCNSSDWWHQFFQKRKSKNQFWIPISDSQMADSLPPQKKHHNVFTFTSILFFISLFLILLILFRNERTFNVFISSSINPDLLSQTTTTNSPSPILQPQSISPHFNQIPEIESPISTGEPTDATIDGERRENETEITPFEKNENLGFVNGPVSVNGSFENGVEEAKKSGKGCNLYMGKWVRDDGYPIYQPGSCPFVDEAYDCQNNGRPDFDFMKWRWKPDDCDLPRFNATDFLVRIRGKRLLLVGDSMNRNQFESMLCLLHEGLPDKSKMYEVHGYKITKGRGFYIFKFVDFNCTIEYVRSHFLVKEGTRINGQGNSNPTLSIDKIDKTARRWKQADILVFNTGHWWTHGKTSRGKNYFKEGDYLYPRFDAVEAYRRALKTWREWIDNNLNPARQLVFYRAYSSAHFRGGDWDSGGTCNGEKEPIFGSAFLDSYPMKMKIVEDVIQRMKVPVILLNITRLTNFRKDGHPSVYGRMRTKGMKVSTRKQDCSHWCLPGVPDAWNELIYATLVYQQTAIRQL